MSCCSFFPLLFLAFLSGLRADCPFNKDCGGLNDPCYYEVEVEYLGESQDSFNYTCLNFSWPNQKHIQPCFTLDRFDIGQVETLIKLNPTRGQKLRMRDYGHVFMILDLDGKEVFPDIISCDGIHVGANVIVKLGEECKFEGSTGANFPGFKFLGAEKYASVLWENNCVYDLYLSFQYDELKKAIDDGKICFEDKLNVTIAGGRMEICKSEFINALDYTGADKWSKEWRDHELALLKIDPTKC